MKNKDSKEKKLQTLSPDQQLMLKVFSVICTEGLEKDVAALFVPGVSTQSFMTGVERLSLDGWISCDCRKIYCGKLVAEEIQSICPVQTDGVVCLLTALLKQIELRPLDDQLSRQPYFVVARLLLNYVMSQWNVLCRDDVTLKALFARNVIAFATNAELSFYGNKRQPVAHIEDRCDFMLLSFLKELYNNQPEGIVNRLKGQLYTSNFRYSDAKRAFLDAARHADDEGALLLAEAAMHENLGLWGSAFQYAYRAYLWNQQNGSDDSNIEVCLYLACLCGVMNAPESCRRWRDEARSLTGRRRIPYGHPVSIRLKEAEALLHPDSMPLALQILDDAELETARLYGGEAPEMGHIAIIRSFIYDQAGQARKSNNASRRYVEVNHFNYGFSIGDTAVLYSEILSDNLLRGNHATTALYASRLRDLHSGSVYLAPVVRFCEEITNCAFHYVGGDLPLSRQHLKNARNIYKRELQISQETKAEIAPVFHDGVIPEAVLMTHCQKMMNLYGVNICLSEGNIREAEKMIAICFAEATDSYEKLSWMIQKGCLLVSSGKAADGVCLWRKILGMSPDAHRFSLARDIADNASILDLLTEAADFYAEALAADTMAYGKESEIADTFCSYAAVLQQAGWNAKAEKLWKEAAPIIRSMNDNDGLSMLYLSWALACGGCEAESLLHKALEFWEPDPELYDETLSKIYHCLCCVQANLGKREEAGVSARKAINLFPGDYPPDLLSEIADYI